MGDVRTFLEDVQTRVAALQDGGSDAFSKVAIMPFLDLDRALKIPRFPMAIIRDQGGVLDPYNQEIMIRDFSVTIVMLSVRGADHEIKTLDILDKGEVLVSGMKYDSDIEVFNAIDDDLEIVETTASDMVLMKTYNFTVMVDLG